MRILTILSCLACFFLFSQCTPEPTCVIEYHVDFPLTISPHQDTFQLGDTIWCEMDLPNLILNKQTGENVDFSNFDLFFKTFIYRKDTSISMEATTQFNIEPIVGSIDQQAGSPFTYTYIHFPSSDNKHFKLALIPTKAGTFTLNIVLPTYFYDLENDVELKIKQTSCEQYIYHFYDIPVNNGNFNWHLIQGVCQYDLYEQDTFCHTNPLNYDDGTYSFVVQ